MMDKHTRFFTVSGLCAALTTTMILLAPALVAAARLVDNGQGDGTGLLIRAAGKAGGMGHAAGLERPLVQPAGSSSLTQAQQEQQQAPEHADQQTHGGRGAGAAMQPSDMRVQPHLFRRSLIHNLPVHHPARMHHPQEAVDSHTERRQHLEAAIQTQHRQLDGAAHAIEQLQHEAQRVYQQHVQQQHQQHQQAQHKADQQLYDQHQGQQGQQHQLSQQQQEQQHPLDQHQGQQQQEQEVMSAPQPLLRGTHVPTAHLAQVAHAPTGASQQRNLQSSQVDDAGQGVASAAGGSPKAAHLQTEALHAAQRRATAHTGADPDWQRHQQQLQQQQQQLQEQQHQLQQQQYQLQQLQQQLQQQQHQQQLDRATGARLDPEPEDLYTIGQEGEEEEDEGGSWGLGTRLAWDEYRQSAPIGKAPRKLLKAGWELLAEQAQRLAHADGKRRRRSEL